MSLNFGSLFHPHRIRSHGILQGEAEAASDWAVEVKGLKKTFVSGWRKKREKAALKGIDLRIPRGALYGILGPNGAGKTTLLSILCHLLTPDEGAVRVLGRGIPRQAKEVLPRINLSSGNANFLWSLTVRENLDYYARLYGLTARKRHSRVGELLTMFELREFERARFDELSTGTKQRLSLAKALINEPELLFLDEPTVGLDPDVARRIRLAIQGLHREGRTTIVLTTHNMREAEALCEELVFLKEGIVHSQGKPREIKHTLRLGDSIFIACSGSVPVLELSALAGVFRVETKDTSCCLVVDDHRERLPSILDLFASKRAFIQDLRIEESDLEDVFLAFSR